MKTNQKWVRITDCRNIPLREGRSVKVGGHDVAIFNLGDRFVAIENRCPHRGGPLADGIISGATVVCPLHAWKVDLATGTAAGSPGFAGCVQTFDVRVDNGCIFLAIPRSARTQKEVPMPAGSEGCPPTWALPTMLDLDDSTVGKVEI
jgi:nitrite reductase (NADH) small subunit